MPLLTDNGGLVAWLLPTHGLHSLEKLLPLQRAFRQCVEHVQAMDTLYEERPDHYGYSGKLDFSTFYKDLLSWTGQPFLSQLNQITMATSKGPSADKIMNDPAYERTRENMSEFGRAGKAASLVRDLFRDLTSFAKDAEIQSRLLTVLKRTLSADTVSKRGERTVTLGDQRQLKGFNFNARASLKSSLFVKCPVAIDRVTGQVTITIPSFVPKTMVSVATGTTHFRIVAGAGTVNFETEETTYDRGSTDEIAWDNLRIAASTIVLNLPPNSPDTILVALGIEYNQQLNGDSYPLKSVQRNATAIVAVNKP
ncbi:hypothetical protein D3H65_09255 [Paraflavitalea soli]|uniref:DUF4469 domain-containing protein n=2 Tax=Paraflavitalea soli TaxID=2315862 RepID=A0A3B7MIW7_9BACT|nr:hypothetical protein D3H65_09255 [Paraflavitalea soli]